MKIKYLHKINEGLFFSDLVYACEVTTQLIHNEINNNIDDLIPLELIESIKTKTAELKTNQTKDAEKTLFYTSEIESNFADKVYQFINDQLMAINCKFNNRFTDEQIRGLEIHIKQLITPKEAKSMVEWHYAFNFHLLDVKALNILIENLIVKRWSEVLAAHKIKHDETLIEKFYKNELVAAKKSKKVFTNLVKKDLNDLLSVIEHKTENNIRIAHYILNEYLDDFLYEDNHKTNQICTFIYQAPTLITKDISVECIKIASHMAVNYLLESQPKADNGSGLPDFRYFVQENKKEMIDKGFPQKKYQDWLQDKNIDVLNQAIKLAFNKTDNNRLKIKGFNQALLPCGMFLSIQKLNLISYMINSYKIKDKNGVSVTVYREHIDIFNISTSNLSNALEAIFLNIIYSTNGYEHCRIDFQKVKENSFNNYAVMDFMVSILKVIKIEIEYKDLENALYQAINTYESKGMCSVEKKMLKKVMKSIEGRKPVELFFKTVHGINLVRKSK
jgi:hypothetical protein